MSSKTIPFAKAVELTGRGPFQLPKMRGAVSFGGATWDWPVLRLETIQGETVLVPLAAEAINALRLDIRRWLRDPENPLNNHRA